MLSNHQHFRKTSIQVLIVSIILLSSIFTPLLNAQDTSGAPSLQRQDLIQIQEESLSWFQNTLNQSTGRLMNETNELTLTDHILTGIILELYASDISSSNEILTNAVEGILNDYSENETNHSLFTHALLLNFLYRIPSSFSNESTKERIANHILFSTTKSHLFNTSQVVSQEGAAALQALILHYDYTNNYSKQQEIAMIIHAYNETLYNHYQLFTKNNTNNTEIYNLSFFTIPLSTIYTIDEQFIQPYSLIIHINNQLQHIQQRKRPGDTLGQYIQNDPTKRLVHQLHSINSMSQAYNLSKTMDDSQNTTAFKESLILGLIYLKNIRKADWTDTPSPSEHLLLLSILHKTLSVLPDEPWTFLWDSDKGQLLEGRALEPSPTLWTALTIGVMGSIGLLALVFIIIGLYYKNKR